MAESAVKSVAIPFGETNLVVKTGHLAKQAGGAVTVRFGDTVILVAATVADEARVGGDFFPLTVDVEERFYAVGKISSSKFIKRENKASDEGILKSRLIDRSIRPLFPKTFRRETQVVITVLSYDTEHEFSAAAVVGASAALCLTDAPFNGPIGAARVGRVKGQLVLNPTESQLIESDLDLLVSGTADRVVMIEAAANEVSEDVVKEAIKFAQAAIAKTIEAQQPFVHAKTEEVELDQFGPVKEAVAEQMAKIVTITDRHERGAKYKEILAETKEKLAEAYDESTITQGVEMAFHYAIRNLILNDKKRPDGRAMDEIREITAEVAVLPRVHGSGLFNRGETQALTIATLAGPGAEQWIETMNEDARKRYMHHYNFPPYSTGEVKRLGTGRREIGHGALAEKALVPMLPSREEFPYTIRLVSEILGSNGSSSMASVCGSTLALMDAGVPLKKPVAGVAMGLVSSPDAKKFQVLTDLQGLEDFAGEMDFKVAGTRDGITAIQLDIKNQGLTEEIIATTLKDAYVSRLAILDLMAKTIDKPRAELSKFAPRIITAHIDPEKIGELIGPGGKNINGLIEHFGGKDVLTVDIEEDGTVMITSLDAKAAEGVKETIESIAKPVEIGQEFEGEVVSIVTDRNSGKEIGAIVQLTPNRDGMIHISSLGTNGQYVNKVSDVVKIGEQMKVRVKDVDPERGRISLSRV